MCLWSSPARAVGVLVFACGLAAGCSAGAEDPPLKSRQALIQGCSKHEQCEDGNPCTQNLCALGICAPALPVLGCCFNGECTGEGGAGSDEPEITPPAGCSKDSQCEDNNPCTENLCAAGLCAALPVLGCCFHGECSSSGGAGGESNGSETSHGGTSSSGGKGGSASGTGATAAGGHAPNATGGEAAQAGESSGESGSSASASGAGSGHKDDGQPGDDASWEMQGGSCSVRAAGGKGTGTALALSLALAVTILGRRKKKRTAPALALIAALALSAHARAAGFAQDSYTAPAAPSDLMWTERAGSDSGHLRPFARLTLGYADDPLVLVDANDSSRQIRVVDDQFAAYGALGLGLLHRAHLALLMPLYVQSSAVPSSADAIRGARPGDLGVDARVALLDRHAPVELALAATLRFPTGDRSAYASDGSVQLWPRALLSKQLSSDGSLLNFSVGPLLRPTRHDASLELGSQLRFSAGVLLALSRVVGLTAELATSTTTSRWFERDTTPAEGAVGGRLTFSSVVLGTSVGTGLTPGVGSPDFRWLVMLAVPGPCDDPVPVAPPTAPPAPAIAPTPVVDDDPDRDAIRGASDRCPSEAEDKDGFEDQDGCPEADNDHDGIDDAADKCPDEAEDLDHWQDEDGCPETDNDQDGVLDAQDQCPNEAETKNGIDDQDGCPDLVRVEAGQIRTLEPIYFDYNKASIQARSLPLLEEMAQLIVSRPDLGNIAIQGHTDARGSAKYNLKLSKDRAAAVRAFLVGKSVPEGRLSSDGFGSSRPIEDNKTEAGRAKNRRVEFHFGEVPVAP